MKRVIFYLTCVFLLSNQLRADSLNVTNFGNLFISNFTPDMYQSWNQNWDVCEGDDGLLYVANGAFLEGGSDFWNSFRIKEDKYVRSVHRHHSGAILVGANEEIGLYNRSGLPGETNYTSLMGRLDSTYHSFGSVWQILDHDSIYYFRAGRAILQYDNDTIVPILFGDIVDYMNFLGDELNVLIAGKGFGTIVKGEFKLYPYGSFFADKRIKSIFPFREDHFLIFTDDNGVFLADKEKSVPYSRFSVPEIVHAQISSAIMLNDNYVAIGTVRNGLYILDASGKIIQHVNRKTGLQNNTIINMYSDESHNLWLALDYGLSYVYLNSCLSILNNDSDIGTGYVSVLYKDKLYLGTNQGLYYMDWKKYEDIIPGNIQIFPVANTSGQVWNLQIIENTLYCSHHKGLYKIDDDEAELVSSQEGSWRIDEVVNIPGYYLQSTYRGFFLYKLDKDNGLALVKKMEDINTSRVFSMDEQGYIWNISDGNHIWRYRIDPKTLNVSEREVFLPGEGHDFERVRILGNKKQVIFNSENGFFSYDDLSGKFRSLTYYNELFSRNEFMAEFFEDDYDRIWYVSESEIGYFSTRFGQMKKVTRPFNLVSRSYTIYLGIVDVIDEDNILFGVERGFYHFNANCSMMPPKDYHSFIVDLKTFAPPKKTAHKSSGKSHPVYTHAKNSFDFSFSSNILESQEKVQYKYKLEGYDSEWSEWSDRNSKEYGNLYEGTYTLKVLARDESGIESDVSEFTFQVMPPPYRSVYAFLLYLVLLALLILLGIRYRDRKVEQERMKIEAEKLHELEEKKKKYEEEQLKSKQRITELVNDRLHQDLKHKSKELSNSMINILHKNEILLNLKQEMQDLYLEKNLNKRDFKIKKLINVIDREISTKKDLEVFDSNFNAVHEEFIKNLKEMYPSLNQNDHRLCTFIKMNKTTKEIATFLNLSIRGVETSRYRLRKKMNLDSDENLYDIISSI